MPKLLPYPFLFAISTLVPVLLLSGFQQNTQETLTKQQLNEQSVLATNWVQQSGEYRALAYQSFNMAKLAFDNAVLRGIKNPAVVVDLDETLIDNSAYQASLIDTEQEFNSKTWNQWIKSEMAKVIPGAVEFSNYVNAKGGKVFFISDREESSTKDTKNNDLELATINNLKNLGFTGANENSLLLKGEFTQIVDGQENNSKELRRQAITQGKADGISYQIVLLLGDNLNDFDDKAGKTNEQRRSYVDSIKNKYGVSNGEITYIVLPNPMYGAWESGMYNPKIFNKDKWFEMTPSEKNEQRKKLLNKWSDPNIQPK
jgi:5'-nucleotidase (lipoprotein e(P4) family)